MSSFCIRNDYVKQSARRLAVGLASSNIQHVPLFQKQHSLQVQYPGAGCEPDCSGRKRIFLPISERKTRGSLTIEAALAMTVFLFAVMSLLGIFSIIRTEIQVQTALEQTGNQLASVPETASLVTATLLFQERLAANGVDEDLIVGGPLMVSLQQSTVMGDHPVIDLAVVYRIKIPFWPDAAPTLEIVQRSRKHAFGAGDFLAEERDYVYITPRGEVYHESLYCTYIRPVTEKIAFETVDERRNQNGSGYDACKFCFTGEPLQVVWITQWGDRYHQSEYCRGVWHDVEEVSCTEVGEMRACSKCGKEDE